ncbi:MAG: hypothetical protein ACK4ND_20095 [Cytophagaceae bacterium]
MKNTFIASIVALVLFSIALLVNAFRMELFGIIPGYAPHNFGFNILFLLPCLAFLHFIFFCIYKNFIELGG